jgi:hypothetical protein
LSFLPPSFGHTYHTKGLFYVQTSFFFITGMLPVSAIKKELPKQLNCSATIAPVTSFRK